MEEEYKSYFRLFPEMSSSENLINNNNIIELMGSAKFNDYFKSSEQIYTRVMMSRPDAPYNNKRITENSESQGNDSGADPMLGLIVQKMPGIEND